MLAGEDGMYVGGLPAGPDGVEEVFWHVGCKAPEVPQKLGRLMAAHLLERE
jgi:hypothetical protein